LSGHRKATIAAIAAQLDRTFPQRRGQISIARHGPPGFPQVIPAAHSFGWPGASLAHLAAAHSPPLGTALGKGLDLIFMALRTPERQAVHA
jgi:hypothetical protein